MANVVEIMDPIYEPETLNTYYRKVGTKEFQWYTINPVIPVTAAIPVNREYRFVDTLKDRQFVLEHARVLLTFQITNAGAAYAGGEPVAISPDSLFQQVRIKLGNSDINSGYGFKDNNQHKWAHISKLIQYSPSHAQLVAQEELFYPDSSKTTSLSYNYPYQLAGVVVTENGQNTNYLQVGTTVGPAGAQPNGVNAVVITGPGSGVLSLRNDPLYNQGWDKIHRRLVNSAPYCVSIPLKYYAPSLDALGDAMSGFTLEVVTKLNLDAEACFCQQIYNGAGVAYTQYTAQLAVSDIKLQIPMYTPNDEALQLYVNRIERGFISVRKYVDVDVIQWSGQLVGNGTVTTTLADFTSVLDRKPIAVLFGYQYAADYNTISGCCNRYFNPQPSSAYMQLGNGQRFPRDPFQANNTGNRYQEFYHSLLKVCDIVGPQKSMMLDYQSFLNHKFLFAFDLRDIDPSNFNIGGALRITFNANHAAIPAAPLVAANTNAGIYGNPPGGNANLFMFLIMERNIRVTQTPSGTTLDNNWVDNN